MFLATSRFPFTLPVPQGSLPSLIAFLPIKVLDHLKRDGWKSLVKHEIYRGLLPRQPYDQRSEDPSPTMRWHLICADAGIVLFSIFLLYAVVVISITYTATDVKAVTIK